MHPEELQRTIDNYRTKGIIVDANLLLLYFVGRYDPHLIEKFKRTSHYTLDDFDLLANILSCFSFIVTTPNVLTEVSNLSGHLPESARLAYFKEFRKQILVLEERYLPSRVVCEKAHFERVGLTDSVIADLSENKHLVLTDDVGLAVLLENQGIDVINFAHVRRLHWTAS
jgi:rRNA-processing protein FCF1